MKQIIINCESLQTRIAVTEDGRIDEYYVEPTDTERIVGSIYKGKIRNLEPSLQAAFVDIGLEKNAFLHYWDMIPATKETLEREGSSDEEDIEEEEEDVESPVGKKVPSDWRENGRPQSLGQRLRTLNKTIASFFGKEPKAPPSRLPHGRRRPRGKAPVRTPRIELDEIPTKFGANSTVIVQVSKGMIGTKGPRVTTNLSIPGRYVVVMPNSSHRGVSRRIEDRRERMRLRDILQRMRLPRRTGVICRTASAGLDEAALRLDIEMILDRWSKASDLMQRTRAPACVYREPSLVERAIRDFLTEDIDQIIVDSKEMYELTLGYVKRLEKKDRTKVKFYNSPTPVFNNYRLDGQIREIFRRKVTMPSGAELCVDETEALVAIDINSGRSIKGKDHPETILNTNLEAAEEVGRQLRLRNVGGLIVVDFIDMRAHKHRLEVYQTLKRALSGDRARTKLLPISRLGLLEMTRQREYSSLRHSAYDPCNYCDGRGVVKSSVTISVELQRRLQEVLRRDRGRTRIRVIVNPDVLDRLRRQDAAILESMEDQFGGTLTFRADPDIHQEAFRLVNEDTGREIK